MRRKEPETHLKENHRNLKTDNEDYIPMKIMGPRPGQLQIAFVGRTLQGTASGKLPKSSPMQLQDSMITLNRGLPFWHYYDHTGNSN